MRKKTDRNVAFLLTFLLIVAILLIYAQLSFSPTGLAVIGDQTCNGNWTNTTSTWINETDSCINIIYTSIDTTDCNSTINELDCQSCTPSVIDVNGECINGLRTIDKVSVYLNCSNSTVSYPDQLCTYCGDSEIQTPNDNGINEECEIDSTTETCTTTEGYDGIKDCNSSICSWGDCITNQSCGDGIINGNEECDDGNTDNGDGCSSSCMTECVPDCSGKECGDNGCGGSCGSCDSGYTCENGECEEEEDDSDSGGSSSSEESSGTFSSSDDLIKTSTETCTPNWECGEWGECVNDMQDRVCTDINQCDSSEGMPETSQTCVVEIKETCSDGIKNQDEKGIDCGGPCEESCGFFTIVGSAISAPVGAGKDFVLKGMFGNTTKTIISIASLVLVAGGIVLVVLFKKKILNFPFPSLFKKISPKIKKTSSATENENL